MSPQPPFLKTRILETRCPSDVGVWDERCEGWLAFWGSYSRSVMGYGCCMVPIGFARLSMDAAESQG